MSKELRGSSVKRPSIPAPLRVLGECTPTAEILRSAAEAGLPVTFTQAPRAASGDPVDEAAIDPALHRAADAPSQPSSQPPSKPPSQPPSPPPPGVGYAGMSPSQREHFLRWAADPTAPAAPAYQQLYVANLEPYLLESAAARATLARHLVSLSLAPAWSGNLWLTRAILLAFWLDQAGEPLANWLDQGHSAPAMLGIALGQQALLRVPMQPPTLATTLAAWQIGTDQTLPELLKLRLASLTTVLGGDPLEVALSRLDPEAAAPRPWRAANRLIRVALPQPDLRPSLEPLLRDLPDASGDEILIAPPDEADDSQPEADSSWQLILEFGHSTSDYFEMALRHAQKQPGYSQLMDENRQMVYRVAFRKRDMRRFWRLWEIVQGWATTRVYLNGDELEKWKVWPYSQYLR